MRVFLDTNVWLSATVFAGLCETLVTACADQGWLVTCPLVQEEAHIVLARKFPHLPQASALFDAAWNEIPRTPDVPDPADDNNRRLLAAAVAAGAQLFVTGDKRLLEWKTSGPLRIVTPRQAWILLFAPHLQH